MKSWNLLISIAILLCVQLTLVWPSPVAQSLGEEELKTIALRNLASRNGSNIESLSIVHTSSPNTRLTEIRAMTFTIVDQFGVPVDVTIDSTGKEVDRETLLANENKAYNERYGNLTPELAKRIEASNGHELIPVVIVLRDTKIEQEQPQRPFIDSETYLSMSSIEKKAVLDSEEIWRVEMDSYLRVRTRRILEPFVARLSSLGADFHPDNYFLQVSARLSAEGLEEVNKWDEVLMI